MSDDSSSKSAEAKALERLKDLDDPNQWVDVGNEEVDLEFLDQKISDIGYLLVIPELGDQSIPPPPSAG